MIARSLRAVVGQASGLPATDGRPEAYPTKKRAARARGAVLWGAALFALASAGLSAAVETVLPQLRDPEYGYRLVRAHEQQRRHPDRPLVLVLGTSRTANGFSPAAAGANDPGAPLPFNFGLAGASPLHLRTALAALRADGVRPAAVAVELFPASLAADEPPDRLCAPAAAKLTAADLARLEPYLGDPSALRRAWLAARLSPFAAQRQVIMNHIAPALLPKGQRLDHYWRNTDRFGFDAYPAHTADAERPRRLAERRKTYQPLARDAAVGPHADAAIRGLVADCRTSGTPLAFFTTPESPEFRSWYTAESRARIAAYMRNLSAELGVPVFAAPDDYAETDFADGHHLLPSAAARFSRELAERHLRPWLAGEDTVTAPVLRPRWLWLTRLSFARRAARPGARGSTARRALAVGTLAFALMTLVLAALVESRKPEWRDPEYGHRLRQVREWQAKRPDRPLVVFVGSSRVQMGISPADMGFADAPGSPLVYNLGYRFATPAVAWLQLQRLLDDGVRPAAVVLVVAAVELNLDGPAERQLAGRGARLSPSDLRRLGPYTDDPTAFARDRWTARLDAWNVRREAVVSDWLPRWQTPTARRAHEGWEAMDAYGFVPLEASRGTDAARAAAWVDVRDIFAPTMNGSLPHPFAARVIRDLIGRCRERGIAVAIAWSPESPRYRSLYTPAARAGIAAYSRALSELGVPVFADPEDLGEDDFADGFHLVSGGAAKYSRRLADAHLRLWLSR